MPAPPRSECSSPRASNKSQPQPQTSLCGPPPQSSFCDPRARSAPGSAASHPVNPSSVGTSWEHSFLAVKMETVAKDTSPGEHKRKKQRVRTPSAEKGEGQQPPPDSARNRKRFPGQAASLSHMVLLPPPSLEAANGLSALTHPLCLQLLPCRLLSYGLPEELPL